MNAENYRKSEGDLSLISKKLYEEGCAVANDPLGAWQEGFRAAEDGLIPVLASLIKQISHQPSESQDLMSRIATLEQVIVSKDKVIQDSRGMVQTSYDVVCDKNALLRDCRTLLSGQEFSDLNGVKELLVRL